MFSNNESSRELHEREFLSQIINDPQILSITAIKPKYLITKELSKLMEDLLFIFENYNDINISLINKAYLDFNKEINLDLYIELLNDRLYEKAKNEAIKNAEECIVKFYKKDVLKQLTNQLNEGKITQDDFSLKVNKLNDIKLCAEISPLTEQEILENIKEQKLIKFENYPKLSKTLKLAQNDLLVIGSMTGTGKTGFLLNLQNDLMNNYQCIYFNMEMSKSSIYKRMIGINADVPVNSIETPSDYQQELINKAIKSIDINKVIMEHQLNKVNEIKGLIKKVKDKNKHTIIFLDHIGLLKIDGKTSLYEQMTEIMKQLRQICLEYDCTIIGASQLNRASYTSENLSVSMLKDSGELENSARKIILLYRDPSVPKEELEPRMFVDVQKNDSGATGIVEMKYYKTKQIFKEI